MGHKDTRMLDRVYARLPPELLRVRLLAALGRCSAGAVNTSGEGAQNGRIGQQVDDLTAEKLAPEVGGARTWKFSQKFVKHEPEQ